MGAINDKKKKKGRNFDSSSNKNQQKLKNNSPTPPPDPMTPVNPAVIEWGIATFGPIAVDKLRGPAGINCLLYLDGRFVTPLAAAVSSGDMTIVRILLDGGAHPTSTELDNAVVSGQVEVRLCVCVFFFFFFFFFFFGASVDADALLPPCSHFVF